MAIVIDCMTGEVTVGPDPDPPTVEELRVKLWSRAKVIRDQHIDGGVPVAGIGTFDSDLVSRTNISGSVTGAIIAQSASLPFSVSWKLADNSIVVLDAAQMIAAGMAVMQHVAACHANAQAMGLAIIAAEDAEALGLIDLEAGWP